MAGPFPKRFTGWDSLGMNKTLIDGLKDASQKCITKRSLVDTPGWSRAMHASVFILT